LKGASKNKGRVGRPETKWVETGDLPAVGFAPILGVNFRLENIAMPSANGVIIRDPDALGGTPVFRGTRVPFQTLLD
jgi:hypothetical protein